jgi:hypothetical protein
MWTPEEDGARAVRPDARKRIAAGDSGFNGIGIRAFTKVRETVTDPATRLDALFPAAAPGGIGGMRGGRGGGTGRGGHSVSTPQTLDEKAWTEATDAIVGSRPDSVTAVTLVNVGISAVTVVSVWGWVYLCHSGLSACLPFCVCVLSTCVYIQYNSSVILYVLVTFI